MSNNNEINLENYPGPLKSGFPLFDSVKLAKATEQKITKGNLRKYSRFGDTINYRTGIATGYTVGCCLRCIFCWASESRDCMIEDATFYSPQDVFERLKCIAERKHLNQIRLSDAEPTIGKKHLLELLELIERTNFKRFILETNGILLGYDRDYVRSLSQFTKLQVRVSLKAGTAKDFSRKTGATPYAFELPFEAIRNLRAEGVTHWVAAMSGDPRFMSPLERISLIGKLAEIDPKLVINLEEEMVVLFPDTLKRLKAAGWDLPPSRSMALYKMPLLRKLLQVSYRKTRSLGQSKISLRYTVKAIRELCHGT